RTADLTRPFARLRAPAPRAASFAVLGIALCASLAAAPGGRAESAIATNAVAPAETASTAPSSAARPGPEQSAAQRFADANAAFAAGRYDEAIAEFRSIVETDGASAALLFDLGNACFRAGRLAEAILWYERARLLAPRDPDVAANLR